MDNELYHVSPRKGYAKQDHKYIKREQINGKWRYWYKLPTSKNTTENSSTRVSKFVKAGKQNLSKLGSKPTDSKSSNLLNTIKETIHKYVKKVPVEGDTYRYFYSDKAYKTYVNGKKNVDKAIEKNLNATPSDTMKQNAEMFTLKALLNGFGKTVYSVAAPAFVALQVALTTPKSFKDLKKTTTEQTNDEHQKAVNPNYSPFTYDNSMNCAFCTATYDLRKRGYDVEANPISTMEGYTIDDICSWYKDAEYVSEQDVKISSDYYIKQSYDNLYKDNRAAALEENLKRYGEGARGHLGLYWRMGGGHDVIWEIENGEVVIRDCQINQVVELEDYLSRSSSYDYVRTDNLEPTEDVLRTVRNRK